MAIAGLEAVHTPSPDFPRWLEQINKLREPDGTFGKGAGKAYTTGGMCGGDPAHGDEAGKPRRDHQRDQGRPARRWPGPRKTGPPTSVRATA